MTKKISSLLFGSIRAKLIFVVVLLHAVLVLFIIGDIVNRQEDFMQKQVYAQSQNMAKTLAANAPSWLLSSDLAGLDELVNSIKNLENMQIAMILDENLKVLASTDKSIVDLTLSDDYSVLLQKTIEQKSSNGKHQIWHDNTIDSMNEIVANGTIVGYSRVILDTSLFEQEMSQIKLDGIIYIILAMIFGAFATWLTVYAMTKQLVNLSNVADEVANGNLNIVIPQYKGKDEVARLTNDFNKMLLKLQQGVHQSKLAMMGELLSMIAHQWRQPLSAISATSSGLNLRAQLGDVDHESIIENTEKISQFAQHLSATIDDFRDFYKTTKEKKNITYEDVIKNVLKIIETSIVNKKITLLTEFNCNEQIMTYPNELKQVVLNFIKNAEDILVDNQIQNPYIRITTDKTDTHYILSVSDNGGGIPADIIGHIFEAYYSTKKQKDGTGLGLYMSKIIIEENCKGILKVENLAEGACFTIMLSRDLSV